MLSNDDEAKLREVMRRVLLLVSHEVEYDDGEHLWGNDHDCGTTAEFVDEAVGIFR